MIEALRDRMKYLRGTSGRGRILKMKTSNGEKEMPSKSICVSPPKLFPEFPPEFPPLEIDEGEDKVSHERHVKVLRTECQKINPNAEVKKKLMERTFTVRRTEILTNPKPVKMVLSMYSPLKEYLEVHVQRSY